MAACCWLVSCLCHSCLQLMLCRVLEFKNMRGNLSYNVLWASPQADAVNITRHLLHEHSSEHPDDAQDFEVVQACHSNLKVSLGCPYICGLESKERKSMRTRRRGLGQY